MKLDSARCWKYFSSTNSAGLSETKSPEGRCSLKAPVCWKQTLRLSFPEIRWLQKIDGFPYSSTAYDSLQRRACLANHYENGTRWWEEFCFRSERWFFKNIFILANVKKIIALESKRSNGSLYAKLYSWTHVCQEKELMTSGLHRNVWIWAQRAPEATSSHTWRHVSRWSGYLKLLCEVFFLGAGSRLVNGNK